MRTKPLQHMEETLVSICSPISWLWMRYSPIIRVGLTNVWKMSKVLSKSKLLRCFTIRWSISVPWSTSYKRLKKRTSSGYSRRLSFMTTHSKMSKMSSKGFASNMESIIRSLATSKYMIDLIIFVISLYDPKKPDITRNKVDFKLKIQQLCTSDNVYFKYRKDRREMLD